MVKDSENERRKKLVEATKMAALSGAGSGAALGLAGSILSGTRGVGNLLKSVLGGAATGGVLSGGAVGTGAALMGPADILESDPYTTRGTVGGLVGGGLAGGLLGAVLGSGVLGRKMPFKAPKFATDMGKRVWNELPTDNVIADYYKRLAKEGGFKRGAALGAGIGGLGAGFMGADEGMQIDFIDNQLRRAEKEKAMREAYNVGL